MLTKERFVKIERSNFGWIRFPYKVQSKVQSILSDSPKAWKHQTYRIQISFLRKRNEKNEIMQNKAIFVAQSFSDRLDIDNEETYYLLKDMIPFWFLNSLTIMKNLDMRLMNVVTGYLNGSLNHDIYMKFPKGFNS